MKTFILFLFCVLAPLSWADNKIEPTKNSISFLLLGQSNMAGQGKLSELPTPMRKLPSNIRFYLNGTLADIKKMKKFGPEVSFAHAVSSKFPKKIINIIKFAPGGSLMRDWLKNGRHYLTLKKQLKIISKNTVINIRGILWMQGERDTKSVVLAKKYRQELSSFVREIRKDFKNQRLTFVIGKISIPESFRPAVKEVKLAQEAIIKELPFTSIFPTDSLEKNNDKVHYSTKGQLKLGYLFARKLLGR